MLGQHLPHGTGHGQPNIGVDVDLAHAALDAALDFFHRHAIGLLYVAAKLANDGQPFLRHAAGAVHHQVGVRDLRMNGDDAVHGQNVARGLARELVGAVAGANRNRQRINAGLGNKVLGLHRVGQHHVVRQFADGPGTIFLSGLAGFQGTQAAQLAFHRHANRVRHFADAARDGDVVLVAGRRLGVFHQRAVHHHAGETGADRLDADGRRGAVVLVHHHRNVGVRFHRGQHHVAQVGLTGVFAGASGGLQNDRAVGLLRRFHDGENLLQVVDIERRHTVAVLGRVVQHLTKGNKSHEISLDI